MIDIPLGKALVPVEYTDGDGCEHCFLFNVEQCICDDFLCSPETLFINTEQRRKDGKNIIFKLVDYPAKVEK
jgi:hypothetical protein